MPQGMDPKGKLKGAVRGAGNEWKKLLNKRLQEERSHLDTALNPSRPSADPALNAAFKVSPGLKERSAAYVDKAAAAGGHKPEMDEERMQILGGWRAERARAIERPWNKPMRMRKD